MIRLLIKENKESPNRFIVEDSQGDILYLINGSWGRKDDVILLFDFKGQLLLRVKQTNFSPFFNFELFQSKEKVGTIRKHPGFFGLRDAFFTVQPHNWVIRGDFEKLFFEGFKDEEKILIVTKAIKEANFLFSLKIKSHEDSALASLLTILLDHYAHSKENSETLDTAEQDAFDLGFLNYKSYSKFYFNNNNIFKKTR